MNKVLQTKMVLGDVDAADYSGLFGVAHSTNSGTAWTKKLDLRGTRW